MEVMPVILQGKHVRLEPMNEVHTPALAEIGIGQSFWDFMVYGEIKTVDDMSNWVLDILSRAEKGTDLPFVVIHLASGRVAGATRYLRSRPRDTSGSGDFTSGFELSTVVVATWLDTYGINSRRFFGAAVTTH